jgi:hypothetical protein
MNFSDEIRTLEQMRERVWQWVSVQLKFASEASIGERVMRDLDVTIALLRELERRQQDAQGRHG